ncbi:MAG: molybdopterin molybdenumtransferase MoeA [Desulfobulbus sp.]|nr:MAG: molybdopterin molybdenumtransferase MoeA [Desulfobulbus sp.]
MISLSEAQSQLNALHPLPPRVFSLDRALGLVCSEDVYACINCPTVDSSLKDGLAVRSPDVMDASFDNPCALTVKGSLSAGDTVNIGSLMPGEAVRIMTGSQIPPGATAVLASEFVNNNEGRIFAVADAEPGRNILRQGSDIQLGQNVLSRGVELRPTHLGLLAAAGVHEVSCYPRAQVAVAATGSELVLPGEPVCRGKVAASNMVTIAAELRARGISATTVLLRDDLEKLQEHFHTLVNQVDVLITCGGVLDGDKDLTLQAMRAIGMEVLFHRVRIGPGKGVCMGMVGTTLIFNLPGGPPSNHVAFLLIAQPGIRRLMGFTKFLPRKLPVVSEEDFHGQKDWTQLMYCRLKYEKDSLYAVVLKNSGRLYAMAEADALLEIPEGCSRVGNDRKAYAWAFRDV